MNTSSLLPLFMLSLNAIAVSGYAGESAIAPVDVNVPVTKSTTVVDDAKTPLRIVAPRGGSGSAQIVITSPTPIAALTATCSELTSKSGGKLPARAIQVRYATRQIDLGPDLFNGCPMFLFAKDKFDGLPRMLVPGETVQPVWILVEVPRDAKPGDYTGTVALRGDGIDRSQAITLHVGAYAVPKVGEQRSWVSMTIFEDAMAARYKVPSWSDAHFKLLDTCFQAVGKLGDNVLYVPVIAKSVMGSEAGIITFSAKGKALTPNFTAFERYLDGYIAACGKPRVLILHVWDPLTEKSGSKVAISVEKGQGQYEDHLIGAYADEDKALWSSVFAGIYDRASKRGIAKHNVLVGVCWDGHPRQDQVDYLAAVAPESPWASFTHGYGGILKQSAYVEQPDGPLTHGRTFDIKEPAVFLRGIGQGPALPPKTMVKLNMQRDCHDDWSAPWVVRLLHDAATDSQFSGIARVGINNWSIPTAMDDLAKYKADRRHRPSLRGFYRWKNDADYGRLYRSPHWTLMLPGPDGVLETTRYQAMREGFHMAEARLACEVALASDSLPAALQEDARSVCRLVYEMEYKKTDKKWESRKFELLPTWQDSLTQIYDLAGKVQAGGK